MISAFEVWVKGHRGMGVHHIINAPKLGQAKYLYLLDLHELAMGFKFTDIRGRCYGPPHSSEDFLRVVRSRGMPDLRCGDRVFMKTCHGVVVSYTSCSNIVVHMDDDSPKYQNLRLNIHPSDVISTHSVDYSSGE